MRTHYLKCWPEWFYALRDGSKTFDVRRDDRGFCVGDKLVLNLFDPGTQCFLGPDGRAIIVTGSLFDAADTVSKYADSITFTITHKLPGGQFGIEPGYCVLGLRKTE